jgi:hypoxanthine phosphoribosyltransferase
MPKSYDYSQRQGELRIDWECFAALSRELAERLAAAGVDMVVGVARAGLLPATAVACALRLDLAPAQVTRREADRVVRERPQWKVDVSEEVKGRAVAVVDEIADTGETLALVAERVRAREAATVVTGALVAHTWADPRPDVVALESDALVIFPWDARVLVDGRWTLHPELSGTGEP